MARTKNKLTAWRLSAAVIKLVTSIAKQSGLTKTAVVEACIAKHAVSIPGLADEARRALIDVVARELGNNKGE